MEGQYEKFAELLDIIVPERGALVVLRYVYMDESGTHQGSPALAMAGYAFKKSQAKKFSRQWRKDLKRFGLPYAHMTDCALGQGDYKKLSLLERVDSEKALIAHTRDFSLFGVAIAVDKLRYDEVFGRGRYDHDAYTFCLTNAVRAVHIWAEQIGYRGRFAYIFEAGHAAQTEANNVMNLIRESRFGESYFSHTFLDKRDAPPLQAADMLAWQYAHYLKRVAEGHPDRRKDFVALLRPTDQLTAVSREMVDQWRKLMDDLDGEILEKLREHLPDITQDELAWAAAQTKQKS